MPNDRRDIGRAFTHAIKTMAETTGYDVFLGRPDKADNELTYPFLVIWPVPPNRVSWSMTLRGYTPRALVQVDANGRDPDETVAALDRLAAVLQGRKPVLDIDGWNPHRIVEQPVQQPVTKNEDAYVAQGQPTYRSWSLWRMAAEPARIPG